MNQDDAARLAKALKRLRTLVGYYDHHLESAGVRVDVCELRLVLAALDRAEASPPATAVPDLRERLTEVLRAHTWYGDESRCWCGYHCEGRQLEVHVAEEIIDALPELGDSTTTVGEGKALDSSGPVMP